MSREGGNERKIVWSCWRDRFARVARDGNDPAAVLSRFASAAVAVERLAYFSKLIDTARS